MRLVIAGSRHFDHITIGDIQYFIGKFGITDITEIVEGGARGVDNAAKQYALAHGIPYKECNANWEEHGHIAGPIRNTEMAGYGDALLLIWNGNSPGSQSIKGATIRLNKPVYEVILRYQPPLPGKK
jgi:hypothetical protein